MGAGPNFIGGPDCNPVYDTVIELLASVIEAEACGLGRRHVSQHSSGAQFVGILDGAGHRGWC